MYSEEEYQRLQRELLTAKDRLGTVVNQQQEALSMLQSARMKLVEHEEKERQARADVERWRDEARRLKEEEAQSRKDTELAKAKAVWAVLQHAMCGGGKAGNI